MAYHEKQYWKNVTRLEMKKQDVNEIEQIKQFFRQNKVKVIKMNHTLKN